MTKWQRTMDTLQASLYLGVPAGTLARWRVEGVGPAYLKLGSRVRYEEGVLDAWVEGQRRRCTKDTKRSHMPAPGRIRGKDLLARLTAEKRLPPSRVPDAE